MFKYKKKVQIVPMISFSHFSKVKWQENWVKFELINYCFQNSYSRRSFVRVTGRGRQSSLGHLFGGRMLIPVKQHIRFHARSPWSISAFDLLMYNSLFADPEIITIISSFLWFREEAEESLFLALFLPFRTWLQSPAQWMAINIFRMN